MEWGVHLLRPVADTEVAFLRRGGLERVTVHLPWRWIEQKRGVLDFAALDHFLQPLVASGLPLQGVLGPGMPHLLPDWLLEAGGADNEDYIRLFAGYCEASADYLRGISVFRVEDELNAAYLWESLRTRRRRGRNWRRAQFRRELLLTAATTVRRARPDAEVRATVQAGLPGWKRELKSWLAAGLSVDRLGVAISPCGLLPHPALAERVGYAVEGARGVLQRMTGVSAPSGGPRTTSLEVSRVAYPTHQRAWSPRLQREFLVGAAQSAADAGAVGFHWWSLRDQAYDDPILRYWTPSAERHMGLMYYDGSPKPALDEYRVVATGDRFGEGSLG
ncbi:MAG TPA: hypothetical protein DIU15_06755 [Deltaproteobacteria bacterium]|nr:hypothetical protein [Deltaproteobacteria bacterium]HCP45722.1 hypothetical protein [Deltaproteobacteria bacterium]